MNLTIDDLNNFYDKKVDSNLLITKDNFSFDKLYLTKDSEFGTHVVYIDDIWDCNIKKRYDIYLDFWSQEDNFDDVLNDIIYEINLKIIRIEEENDK